MPKGIGQPLAPPPSDLMQVLATAAPLDSTVPFDPSTESAYTGKDGARATTAHSSTSAKVTLYGINGDDREITIEDIFDLTSSALEPHRRLYLRCPKCVNLANTGIHPFSGPNGCPAKVAQRFMTCPICASYGKDKRVYEVEPLKATLDADNESDPNYMAAELPDAASGKEQLQDKLYQHMTAFHSTETQQMYGVRREVNGTGFRIVKGRS